MPDILYSNLSSLAFDVFTLLIIIIAAVKQMILLCCDDMFAFPIENT